MSARSVFNHLYFILKKNVLKILVFLKKIVLCNFEPKNCEMIENSSKAPLNFSPLKFTYLGKNYFNIDSAKSEKNKIEKWPLRTSFLCIYKWF